MEFVFGIKGKDCVILCADRNAGRSIIRMKSDENKIKRVSPNVCIAYSGHQGDASRLVSLVARNSDLFYYDNGHRLQTHSLASIAQGFVYDSLRSQDQLSVNLLVGGVDEKACLYTIDNVGTFIECNYAFHGYGSYYCYSIMDRFYRKDLPEEDCIRLVQLCMAEAEKRIPINYGSYLVKVMTKEGVRTV